MLKYLTEDISDLGFRWAFSSIFLGLGLEHLFSDQTIQLLMPQWMPEPRTISILCGVILVSGGGLIFAGLHLRAAAIVLSGFLIVVTAIVHGPGIISHPADLPSQWVWLWEVLQRSNFVKNLCLFGVCLRLFHYTPGKYSLQHWLSRRNDQTI